MLKTALFTGMFRDWSLADVAEIAAEIGYDGLEIRALSHLQANSTNETIQHVKSTVQAYGLRIPVIYTGISGNYATELQERSLNVLQQLRSYIQWAAELGGAMICHSPGGPTPEQAKDSDYERVASWMARVADECANYDLEVVMEIHHNSLIESIDSSLTLLQAIDRSNVGVILDPGNMAIADEEYGPVAVERLGKYLRHVHAKDVIFFDEPPQNRSFGRYRAHIFAVELMGKGGVDHTLTYRALEATGYDGYISFEAQVEGVPSKDIASHEYREFRKAVPKL